MMIALLAFAACVEDVGTDKAVATVEDPPADEVANEEEPKANDEAAPVAAKGVAWAVSTETSTLKALGAKITAKHPIEFSDYAGNVMVDEDKVTGIDFTVQMNAFTTDADQLTEHLKTPDFFDVEKFPTATFASSEVTEGSDEEGFTHTVKGAFTIHGETKVITFPAKIEMGEGEVKASTEFVLNRQDFKITYPGKPDDLVQDNVVLTVEFVAPKPQA